jgi:hypothetical protein
MYPAPFRPIRENVIENVIQPRELSRNVIIYQFQFPPLYNDHYDLNIKWFVSIYFSDNSTVIKRLLTIRRNSIETTNSY